MSTTLTASTLKRRRVDENILSENPSSQPSATEEDLVAQLLACDEKILPLRLPAVLPVASTESLTFYSPETIKSLIASATNYTANPFYLDSAHPELAPKKIRALMAWLMEVHADFRFHRETFHLALSYTHRYLSAARSLPVARLQLLGLAATALAAKLNEVHAPRLAEIAKCAADFYTVRQVEEMELSIVATLGWRLAPATNYFWTNLYACQWDEFSKEGEFADLKFKEMSEDSYRRYTQLLQIVDSASMETEHLQYNQRVLAGSAIYTVLSMCQHDVQYIVQVFAKESKFIFEPSSFNKAFELFAKKHLDFSLEEMLPGVQYVAAFADIPLECEDFMKWEDGVANYEEFLAVQRCKDSQLDYLRARHAN